MASSRVIGLDIGTSAVRAAEVEVPGGRPSPRSTPTLVRYGQVQLPPGAVRDGEVVEQGIVSHALKQLWSRGGFSSKNVVLGVGNQRVVVRDLELPWLPLAQLKASLAFQVQEHLPVAASEALLDFFPTAEREGPQGRVVQGQLVAAQKDTVVSNVLAVESAGLRPTMVDLNAFALLRALGRGEFADRSVAFVDIGARVTTVVVSDRGVPRLIRMLATGGQTVTDAVVAAAAVPASEAEQLKREVGFGFAPPAGREAAAEAVARTCSALVESVRNTFVYYTSSGADRGIDVLVLSGGGAHLPGLGQYLATATRIPAVMGDPLSGVKVAKTVDRSAVSGNESLMALPVGLAYGVAA